MSNRRARWRAKLRLVAAMASLKPAWTPPQVIELSGVEAIIRRSYARFSPDHPMHGREPDYSPDYTSEGARVLTWRPVVAAPVELARAA